MKLSTGRWVSGDDFFNRERELRQLETLVRDHNHILLTGQRRMGKTSVAQELGLRLKAKGWIFLFADVEGATRAEDAIASIAQEIYSIRPIMSHVARAGTMMKRLFGIVEEVGAHEFRVKFRAGLNAGNWRYRGGKLLRYCAKRKKPVLLVIDELPILLKRMLDNDDGTRQVDEFLSWLRGVLQSIRDGSLVLIVSGSIGLEPLVKRLGIPDRINHFYRFRLEPWDRNTSIECFQRLAKSCGLRAEDGVAEAVYNALGVGIPHHVQSFFARLRYHSIMQDRDRVPVEDVEAVYRTELLGPPGQTDLVHYETRLKEALEDGSHIIAMEILAEASTQNVFTPRARRCLERLYARVIDDAPERIADTLEILIHDGYLEAGDYGHRFPSRLLKDWWSARFRDHHSPLEDRYSEDESLGDAQ